MYCIGFSIRSHLKCFARECGAIKKSWSVFCGFIYRSQQRFITYLREECFYTVCLSSGCRRTLGIVPGTVLEFAWSSRKLLVGKWNYRKHVQPQHLAPVHLMRNWVLQFNLEMTPGHSMMENKGRLQDCSCSIGSYHCIQCYAHIL